MTEQLLQTITTNSKYKNYVPPVDEKQLGWNKYANGLSIETCTTDAQRRGWLSANRAQAYAEMIEVTL